MSKVRPFLNDAVPQYTGTYVIQGEVANPALECPGFVKLSQDGNAMAIGDGHVVATHYIANGALVFYVSFRQSENWFTDNRIDVTDRAAVVNFLNETLKSWSPVYRELSAQAGK